MVKKKDEIQEDKPQEGNFTERILKEVEKEFGKGIFISIADVKEDPPEWFSISPNLDIITGGKGFKEGSFNQVSGTTGMGKSSIILAACVSAQKKGRMIYWDNVENRADEKILTGIEGLDPSPDKFMIFGSSRKEKRVLLGSEHLKICEKIIRTHPGCVLVIDSLASLAGDRESADGLGAGMAGAANCGMVTQWVRLIKDVVYVNKVTVIATQKMSSNVSGYGAALKEKGALEYSHQCDCKLIAKSKHYWEAGEKKIGLITKWVCDKSPQGPPGQETESYIRFGIGPDRKYEILELGKLMPGLINKAGSWYTIDFLKEEGIDEDKLRFQGDFKVYQAFQDNPEWFEKLSAKVKEFMGGDK